ncbi:MAG: FKBP-type peptidyl-prolyl cis-trans isomerase [Paludibacteraceae bacterium]|nr:FKBP-type peptidyl-prolyl cis-trans isomerase [Paludibacteraceae bacterium]
MNSFFSTLRAKCQLLLLFSAFLGGISLSVCSCSKDNEMTTEEKNRDNKLAGELFLKSNRDSAGVVETFSGLQYKIDTLGKGAKPLISDSVTIRYTGSRVDGIVFTNTTSSLSVEEQIKGMREGLMLMPEGSVFDLYIPCYLAYASQSNSYYYDGNLVSIPAYSALHFRVKLEKVIPVSLED